MGKRRITAITIEFPKNFTIIGNLALAFWIALGIIGFWLFNPVAGVLFLIAALVGI